MPNDREKLARELLDVYNHQGESCFDSWKCVATHVQSLIDRAYEQGVRDESIKRYNQLNDLINNGGLDAMNIVLMLEKWHKESTDEKGE